MLNIADRLELFIDHTLIDEMHGTQLRLGVPHPAGRVMTFDRPWEGIHPYYLSIVQDGDICRMWYRGVQSERLGAVGMKDGYDGEWTCYAQSRDGIEWDRPNLGLHEVMGSRDNNVCLANMPPWSSDFTVNLNTRPGAPASERYIGIAGLGENMNCFRKGWLPKENAGLHLFFSPDGIHWTKAHKQRFFDDFSRVFDGMNQVFWSDHEQCYVLYYRQHTIGTTGKIVEDSITHRKEYTKTIARSTSVDLVNWTGRHELDWGGHAPTPGECIYCNGLRPYLYDRAPHIYVGLATRFMQGRSALTDQQVEPLAEALVQAGWQDPRNWLGKPGANWLRDDCNDVALLTSRGGDVIDRTFRDAFVRPGMGYERWTSRTNHPAYGLVRTGPAELSLYVLRKYSQVGPYLERMTLRLDGFASLNASYDGGEMLTRPLTFAGSELVLNHAGSAAGSIRVEIQEDNPAHEFADPEPPGKPIPGFTAEDCDEIIGDEIERVVTWKGNPDVSRLAGTPIRLRFVMRDADIYSMRFRRR